MSERLTIAILVAGLPLFVYIGCIILDYALDKIIENINMELK